VQAVRDPGTEVSPTAAAGQARGPRGLLAILRRRPHEPVTDRGELVDGAALERGLSSGGAEPPDDGGDEAHPHPDLTPQ
jgi:hypothetical protein